MSFPQRLAAIVLFLAIPGICLAATPANPSGEWVLNLGKRTLFVLSIHPSDKVGQQFSGSLSRPRHLQSRDMASFSHIQGATEIDPIVASSWKDGSVLITVENPADSKDRTTYLLSQQNENHLQLQMQGVQFPPLRLIRAQGTPAVSTDWDPAKMYSPDDDVPSSAEMKSIFDEDQRVRQAGFFKIDWTTVDKSDAQRREATRKMLNEGDLHTGEDFAEAAVIFNHGPTPNDILLAHTLAMVAVKKGDNDAIWIASATLDRYLWFIKQPQIYGTQFSPRKDQTKTQEPYDRTLIPDSLREELDVPTLTTQDAQRKRYDLERKAAK